MVIAYKGKLKHLNKFKKIIRIKEPHERGTPVQVFAYHECSLEEEQAEETANKHR